MEGNPVETEHTGEVDVPLEGVAIEYPIPFTSWTAHSFQVLAPLVSAGKVIARTHTDHHGGCYVRLWEYFPPEEIGTDPAGNKLFRERPPEPVAGRVAWRAVGE